MGNRRTGSSLNVATLIVLSWLVMLGGFAVSSGSAFAQQSPTGIMVLAPKGSARGVAVIVGGEPTRYAGTSDIPSLTVKVSLNKQDLFARVG
jgi:hypothetical protein